MDDTSLIPSEPLVVEGSGIVIEEPEKIDSSESSTDNNEQ